VVARAKRLAALRRTSVSRLVQGYLTAIADAGGEPEETPPVLRRLRGSLKRSGVSAAAYRRHLAGKYR
jgi:hypothetical protein